MLTEYWRPYFALYLLCLGASLFNCVYILSWSLFNGFCSLKWVGIEMGSGPENTFNETWWTSRVTWKIIGSQTCWLVSLGKKIKEKRTNRTVDTNSGKQILLANYMQIIHLKTLNQFFGPPRRNTVRFYQTSAAIKWGKRNLQHFGGKRISFACKFRFMNKLLKGRNWITSISVFLNPTFPFFSWIRSEFGSFAQFWKYKKVTFVFTPLLY